MTTTATFVMPHYSADLGETRALVERAVGSVRAQQDSDWRLVIVDDASPDPAVVAFLDALAAGSRGRIHVLEQARNQGQGVGRNVGVRWAAEQASPIVLFIDADDACHPGWLRAVRRSLASPDVDVVYTTLVPVDAEDREIPPAALTPSIRQILESHRSGPPEGRDAWMRIVTEFGYVNLTSATAVRTALALRFPFPAERVSEDSHAWLRYSAGGGAFRFVPETPVRYCIAAAPSGSRSREAAGGKAAFYRELVRVDGEGFEAAVELAFDAGRLTIGGAAQLRVRYLHRLAETMRREEQGELARELLARARDGN
jgi:glycosyltransferase involved in cell wall biosynthesis